MYKKITISLGLSTYRLFSSVLFIACVTTFNHGFAQTKQTEVQNSTGASERKGDSQEKDSGQPDAKKLPIRRFRLW